MSAAQSTAGHGNSGTAHLIAHYRAVATSDPQLGTICRDPYAAFFSTDVGAKVAAQQDRVGGLRDMHVWVAARTAFFDGLVCDAIDGGCTQVVLLGAGFDTRSNRLRPTAVVRFFEIDSPNVQGVKVAMARRLAATDPTFVAERSIYVPCDFESQNFLDCLDGSGFARGKAALFVLEGVIYYLTESAARATLKTIASLAASVPRGASGDVALAFDYFSKQSVHGKKNKGGQDLLRDVGEPMTLGINHVLPLVYEEGFRFCVHHDFDELVLNYLGAHQYARMYKFQSVCVCSPAGPPSFLSCGRGQWRLPPATPSKL
jgi:methyltransferase (TIGR00027 family)